MLGAGSGLEGEAGWAATSGVPWPCTLCSSIPVSASHLDKGAVPYLCKSRNKRILFLSLANGTPGFDFEPLKSEPGSQVRGQLWTLLKLNAPLGVRTPPDI